MKPLFIKLLRIPFDLILRAVFIFPVLPVLYFIEPFRKIRFGLMSTQRIGHLTGNTENFIRRNQIYGDNPKTIYIFAGWDPANRQLFKMYKRILPIYESRWLTRILFCLRPLLSRTRFFEPLRWSNKVFECFSKGHRTLAFTDEEDALGRSELAKMGIGEDDWFVCLHVRDSAYLNAWRPQYKELWKTRDFRNCNIENYFQAIEAITKLGGYVLRMGSIVEKPLPEFENPKIIDYATMHRSDFMDIYLSANCRLFLCSDSGLFMVATAFGVPVALTNNIFLRGEPLCSRDMFIPKLVFDTKTGTPLGLREALEMGFYSNSQPPPISEEYTFRENAPEDIQELALEALAQLSGETPDPEGRRISDLYREDFMSDIPGYEHASRMGSAFALKHRQLIEPSMEPASNV